MENWDLSSLDVTPRHPQVLTSYDEGRLVAIDLPVGEELQEHQTHERALLVVIDGQVELIGDGGTVTAGRGHVADFAPKERRTVRASEHSRLLLVLAPWPGEGHPSRRG